MFYKGLAMALLLSGCQPACCIPEENVKEFISSYDGIRGTWRQGCSEIKEGALKGTVLCGAVCEDLSKETNE